MFHILLTEVPMQSVATATEEPAVTAKAKVGPAARPRKPLILAASAAAVGVIAVVVLAVGMATRGDDEPRLNEDTVTLVKFVSGDRYLALPFEQQSQYMKVLEDRDDNDELEDAFEAERVTEAEYRAALQEAWLGQQLKRSEKYAGLTSAAAKEKYINELLNRKEKKKTAKKGKPGGGGNDSADGGADEIKRDKSTEETRLATWPADARARFDAFRRAFDEAKDA